MVRTLTSLALVGCASLVAAQYSSSDATGSLGALSTNCQQAAVTLLGSDFATCANLQGLLGVVTGSGSLVQPINTWLGGLCDRGNCSSAAIQNATSVIDQGCSSDLSDGNTIVTSLRSLVQNFNEEKSYVCLEDTSNSTYCITSLLNEIQTGTGQELSVSSLTSFNLTALTQIPASTVCTPCNSALLYSVAQTGQLNQSEVSMAQSYCNDQSFGTSIPTGVKSATTNSSSSSDGTNASSSTGGTSAGTTHHVGKWTLGAAGLVGTFGLALLV
ncbi:hypothetical protein JCM10212_004228 [Sporobolomyces blumeae]